MAIKFKLGEPFSQTSPDTQHVSSTVTQEGNKFVCIQTAKQEGQQSTKSVCEFTADECIYTLEVLGANQPEFWKDIFKRL